ncbi:MAG TPA: hypothetical protein VN648_32550 [Candidatus Methylomirabilis sp.]|nr:hypothetical protein [Candidatus Methylomirabilis sp.]
MATILIVENDGLAAEHVVRTLRQAGHTPVLAPDTEAALRGMQERPDLLLLDLDVTAGQWSAFLARLICQPENTQIPVLLLVSRRRAGELFPGQERQAVTQVLLKPVSAAHLRQGVDVALAKAWRLKVNPLVSKQDRLAQLIRRLLVGGSDALALHVYRRLCTDRTWSTRPRPAGTLTWTEIAEWGFHEGLLDPDEGRVVQGIPLTVDSEG